MAVAGSFTLNLPERRTRYRFALTPLADAMFQLLIFFMLSSGLTPYALLTLQTASTEPTTQTDVGTSGATGADATQLSSAPQPALWTVEARSVSVRGQRFDFDALDDLAGALALNTASSAVVLIVRPSAQVQSVTTVLARLAAAGIESVQVTAGQGF